MIGTMVGVLTASLIGSVHCVSMCGGFVCFYTGSGVGSNNTAAHMLYNFGRLASYLLLGAIAGIVGSQVSDLGALAGIQQAAAVVAGSLMILWAVSILAAQRGISMRSFRAPQSWQRALGTVLHSARKQPASVRALITGLLTTILPCGWLYVFVAAAGGTGSVPAAMLMMFVFWLGTVPALVAVGYGAQKLFGKFQRQLPTVSAVMVLIMGLWSLSNHLRTASVMNHTAPVGIQNSTPHAH